MHNTTNVATRNNEHEYRQHPFAFFPLHPGILPNSFLTSSSRLINTSPKNIFCCHVVSRESFLPSDNLTTIKFVLDFSHVQGRCPQTGYCSSVLKGVEGSLEILVSPPHVACSYKIINSEILGKPASELRS